MEMNTKYEVHCGNCHWWGYESQLRAISRPNYQAPGDIILVAGCPICYADQWLEYNEYNTYTTMYRLRCFAYTRDQKRLELEQTIRGH